MQRTSRSAVFAVTILSGVLLAGCGGDDDDDAAGTASAPAATAAVTPAPTEAPEPTTAPVTEPDGPATTEPPTGAEGSSGEVVGVGTTELGEVLVDSRGLSLYGFLNDSGGESACYDQCAQAWPPVLVDGAEVPAGLDTSVFSVTERTDGTFQLVAGDWPLYTYFEDAAPGDIVGQGSGGVWYLVDPSGNLIEEAAEGLTNPGY